MNKPELIACLRERREQLVRLLADDCSNRMEEPGLPGGWTIKELLGHFSYWEESIFEAYSLLRLGETPDRLDRGLPLDDLNLRIQMSVKKLSLEEVIRQETEAYQNLLGLVEQAPEEELLDEAKFPWTDGVSIATMISWNSWEHFDEHLVDVRSWLMK